jgi:hypothetical protein
MLPLLLSSVLASQPPALPREVQLRIQQRAQELSVELSRSASQLERVLERQVRQRLEGRPSELNDVEVLERTVVDYEAFRLSAYSRSGVSPKRYFGYLDGLNDTAEEERVLRRTAAGCTRAANAWLASEGSSLRVDDQEIVVTFLAEGGALWLGEDRGFHPIFDVGLDDLVSGSSDLGELQGLLDAEVGTDLGGLIQWSPEGPVLVREMTLEETLAGTALMWVWEKQIAERKLAELGLRPLHERDRAEQFIIGSLVYNSGVLHSPERWTQIRSFEAAEVVWGKSEANAQSRWRLPLVHPELALDALIGGQDYPDQGTDWLAMMHVLQRYGGWEALRRFTDHFDEQGMLVEAATGGSARQQQG